MCCWWRENIYWKYCLSSHCKLIHSFLYHPAWSPQADIILNIFCPAFNFQVMTGITVKPDVLLRATLQYCPTILQYSPTILQFCQGDCSEIHKRFVNKASDWTIRKREAPILLLDQSTIVKSL